MPALGLHERGYESIFLQTGERLLDTSGVAIAIFVKSFSLADLHLAKTLHRAGVPIILDLCDNIFVEGYGSEAAKAAFCCFNELARMAVATVVPTDELAKHIGQAMSCKTTIIVIPDQVETETTVREILRFPRTLPHYRRGVAPRRFSHLPAIVLKTAIPAMRGAIRVVDPDGDLRQSVRQLLRRSEPPAQGGHSVVQRIADKPSSQKGLERRKRIVWFGNHGAAHSSFGMPSLAAIIPHLAAINEEIPLELLVISNNHARFAQLFGNSPFPTIYRAWNPLSIFSDISSGDVCVIPNPKDEFSIGKSANRVVLALALGVPVVADEIPSVAAFKGCIALDDWVAGIKSYLCNPELCARHIARGGLGVPC